VPHSRLARRAMESDHPSQTHGAGGMARVRIAPYSLVAARASTRVPA
jgi:hypothetical protein